MVKLYREKPSIYRAHMFPLYVLPVLVSLTGSFHIVPLFTILASGLLFLSTFWSNKLKILFTLSESKRATYVLYRSTLCRLENDVFEYEGSRFLLRGDCVTRLRADTNRPYRYFTRLWKDEAFVEPELLRKFGDNRFRIDPPTFLGLFMKHAVSPFFVFQVFSGLLWCLDEYVYQALFSLTMLVMLEAGLVFQRILTIKQFRTMSHSAYEVELMDRSRGMPDGPRHLSSEELYPGDVIRISSPARVPCDLLLIGGACAVNEAMLSGESIPLAKEDVSEVDEDRMFDYTKDKKHILYAGTDIVKLKSSSLRCFVLHTGFETQQGELMKRMMCNEEITVNDKEAFIFIGILVVFAAVASVYTYREGVRMGKSGYKIFLEIILILTNVVPTELPIELSMAVNACVKTLIGMGVFCLEPFRIPYAGKINVCCFDKTGTLTETIMDVAGLRQEGPRTFHVLLTCHSLIQIQDKITGDPLETSVYAFLKEKKEPLPGYKIRKTFSFASELKRMTVLADVANETFVAMKGAPEEVRKYLGKVPGEYETYKEYAAEGNRVIALAHKPYNKNGSHERKAIESDLEFAGFVLFDCKLKKHVKETVKILRDSDHRVVMITGDNILTARSVARKIGIPDMGVEGAEIDRVLASEEFYDVSIFARADPMHKERIIERYNKAGMYTLMCGDGTNDVGALKHAHVGIALVEAPIAVKKISSSGSKEVRPFEELSKSLTEDRVKMGDASIAAPFTAKTGSLESVLDVIRQGRSALVTTVQMYKILALNSLVSAFSLSVLDCMGIRYGDVQLTSSGILLAFAFMALTHGRPLKTISRERPILNILNPYIMVSVALQVLVHIASFYVVIDRIKAIEAPLYQEKFSPSLINTALFLLSTVQQLSTFLVNYIGRPFRESLVENKKLSASLLGLLALVFYLVFGGDAEVCTMMGIVDLNGLRCFISLVFVLDILLCFIVEKACFYAFMLR
jgi:manganese-transporting P-type ATPase